MREKECHECGLLSLQSPCFIKAGNLNSSFLFWKAFDLPCYTSNSTLVCVAGWAENLECPAGSSSSFFSCLPANKRSKAYILKVHGCLCIFTWFLAVSITQIFGGNLFILDWCCKKITPCIFSNLPTHHIILQLQYLFFQKFKNSISSGDVDILWVLFSNPGFQHFS